MWWRKGDDRELEEEIAAHLEIEAAQRRSHGLDPDAARAAARRAFGNRTRIAEETRDVWRVGWLEDLWQDLRLGLRSLRNNPGFALAATLVLALGIGPNTALYSIIHAAFFDALGYREPDRLVTVVFEAPHAAGSPGIVWADVFDIESETTSFVSITTAGGGTSYVLGEGEAAPALLRATVQPGHLSKTLGVSPILGRDFLPQEALPGNDLVAILAHKTWMTHFAEDPNIIGKRFRLTGGPNSDFTGAFTIVGVMPPFHGLGDFQASIWTPYTVTRGSRRGLGMAVFTARLKSGITIAQAQADVTRFAAQVSFPGQPFIAIVAPLRGYQMPEATRTTLWLLAGTSAFVLLIACSNFASLMIARGTLRRRELATRVSLGASSGRLLTQLAVETMLVTALGVAMGIGFGWGLLKVLVIQMPAVAAIAGTIPTLSMPVLLATTMVSALAAIFFGCLPMWRASHADVDHVLKGNSGPSARPGRARLRRLLVAFQFAAATALLATAVVSGHRLWLKTQTTSGMRGIDRVLVVNVGWPRGVAQNSMAQIHSYYREVVSRLRPIPGVEDATNSSVPLSPGSPWRFQVQGQPPPPEGARTFVQTIGQGYFSTIGARVLSGRSFDGRDAYTTEPVLMVNEEFLRRYHPRANPVGTYLSLEQLTANGPQFVTRRIVGVYANLIRPGYSDKPIPEVAIPTEQPSTTLVTTLMIRAAPDATGLREQLTSAIQSTNPGRPVPPFQTLDQLAWNLTLRERGYAIVFGLLGALALSLSAAGIYGLMTFLVARRTQEIGLRMAIGATPRRIVSLILNEGLLCAIAGVAVGFIGAYFASQTLQSVLGKTDGLSYLAFAAAAVLLLMSAVFACGLPAYRASQVDPVTALRMD